MKYVVLFALLGAAFGEELHASNSTRASRQLIQDLVNNVDVDTVMDMGSKAFNMARALPAALTSWSLGPATGTVVGVVAMIIFIITIIIVISEVGVVPVGGRSDSVPLLQQLQQPSYLNQRFQRALNSLSAQVHESLDKFSHEDKSD